MAKVLLLWLEGPLQSWSTSAELYRRPTESFPTKSAVWGLIFHALGWYGRQKAALTRVFHLPVRILGFQNAARPALDDYQTIGVGWDESNPWECMMVPKKADGSKSVGGGSRIVVKSYLTNARFAAFVSIPGDWEEAIGRALQNPAGAVYLGKKACVPTAPVFGGIYGDEKEARLGLQAFLCRRYDCEEPESAAFEVEEAQKYAPDVCTLLDNPTSFGGVTECAPRNVRFLFAP